MFDTPETAITGFDYLNATELEEMRRNLNFLYSTRAGTCPRDRNFGLEQAFESCPANVAKNLFALEVIEDGGLRGQGGNIKHRVHTVGRREPDP